MQMPPNANIPDKWVDVADGKKYITVPAWAREGGIYKVEMDLNTRELKCNCLGFKYRGICHHLNYLKSFCSKPEHPHAIGVQQTSLEAYRQVQKKLGEHQRIVFDYIAEYGPVSNYQIAEGLGWPINDVTPRNLELRTMEKVKFAGVKVNPKTGKRVMMWEAV